MRVVVVVSPTTIACCCSFLHCLKCSTNPTGSSFSTPCCSNWFTSSGRCRCARKSWVGCACGETTSRQDAHLANAGYGRGLHDGKGACCVLLFASGAIGGLRRLAYVLDMNSYERRVGQGTNRGISGHHQPACPPCRW